MTLVFDVRTLLFVGSLSSLACTVMLWSSRGLHLPSKAGLRWAAGSQLMFGLAMGAIALRGAIPDLLSFQIAHTLGTGAAALTYEGVRRLTGARPLPWLAVGTNLALLAVNLRLGSEASQFVARLQLNSAVHAVFAAASVPLLLGRLRGGNDALGPLRWATGFMVVFTVGHLLRFGVIATAGAQMSVDGLVEGPLQMLMPTVFALGPMVYAMILLGLVNGRLAADLWRLATIDVLTGVRTRRGFVDEARRMLDEGGRSVLLMLDLDRFKLPQFKSINTFLGNLKRSLSGTYHAFDFAKYAHRYLAEAQYRFNRRFDLRRILPRLLRAACLSTPAPARLLRVAELRR